MTMTASAQYQPPRPYGQYQQDDRDAGSQGRLFDRVRTDLDRIHASTLPYSADRDRVRTAMDQLNQCQEAIHDGHYDRRMFDYTVSSLQRVADLNRLNDQSRTYLIDDIRDLSRLQSRLEGY